MPETIEFTIPVTVTVSSEDGFVTRFDVEHRQDFTDAIADAADAYAKLYLAKAELIEEQSDLISEILDLQIALLDVFEFISPVDLLRLRPNTREAILRSIEDDA